MPLTRLAYRATTASNQPQRRSRPVVTPTSPPCLRRYSPLASNSSVGNGPEPTRVVYALRIPTTRSIRVGPIPEPAAAPPAPPRRPAGGGGGGARGPAAPAAAPPPPAPAARAPPPGRRGPGGVINK